MYHLTSAHTCSGTMNDTYQPLNNDTTNYTLTQIVVIGIVMTILAGLTVVLNGLVLMSFFLDRKLRTLSNYFLLSLAVSDILIGAFAMPMFTQYVLAGERWHLGPALCDLWLTQDYVCGSTSSLHLLVIGFDRYFSVTKPLSYRARRTKKRVVLMIGCAWAVAFLMWPPWIYAWQNDSDGNRVVPGDDCYIQLLVISFYGTLITAILDYYLPLFVMLLLYYKIWQETKRRKKFKACVDSGNYNECLSRRLAKKEAAIACLPCHFAKNSGGAAEQVPSSTAAIKDAGNVLLDPAAENYSARASDEATTSDEEEMGAPVLNAVPEGTVAVAAPAEKNKTDNKAARVLTAILVTYVVTTIPYNVLVIIRNVDCTNSIIPTAVWNLSYFMFYINSTLNPICYALANKSFRRTYWRILSCSWYKRINADYSSSNYSDKSLHSNQNVKNATHV